MFIKCMLIIVLVAIPTLLGFKKSKRYEMRENILREGNTLFKRIANEIKYNLTALPNAIEASRQDFSTCLKDIMGSISTSILDNSYSAQIVSDEINNICALKPYDKQVLTSGIISLGTTDMESQLNMINSTIEALDELEKDAKDEKYKNSKLYRTIGLVTGLMLAIVVI